MPKRDGAAPYLGPTRGVYQVLLLAAHERDQLIIDHFDELLRRLDSLDDLHTQSLLLHTFHKAPHHWERHLHHMLADSVANSLGHHSVAWQLCQLCSTLLQRPLHFIHSSVT